MEQNQKWAFCPVEGEKQYAGIITALDANAQEGTERVQQFKDLIFSPENEGKYVIIDRKKIAETRDKDYEPYRFQAVKIEDGKPMWHQGAAYIQTWLELTQKADSLQEMYDNNNLTLTDNDLNFDSPASGLEQ